MNKVLKILLISSCALCASGLIIFLLGAAFKNNLAMWAGLIIFIIAVIDFLIFFYYRTYLKRKEVDNREIRRN